MFFCGRYAPTMKRKWPPTLCCFQQVSLLLQVSLPSAIPSGSPGEMRVFDTSWTYYKFNFGDSKVRFSSSLDCWATRLNTMPARFTSQKSFVTTDSKCTSVMTINFLGTISCFTFLLVDNRARFKMTQHHKVELECTWKVKSSNPFITAVDISCSVPAPSVASALGGRHRTARLRRIHLDSSGPSVLSEERLFRVITTFIKRPLLKFFWAGTPRRLSSTWCCGQRLFSHRAFVVWCLPASSFRKMNVSCPAICHATFYLVEGSVCFRLLRKALSSWFISFQNYIDTSIFWRVSDLEEPLWLLIHFWVIYVPAVDIQWPEICHGYICFSLETNDAVSLEKSPPLWGSKFLGGKASDWSRIQNPAFWLVQSPSAP